MNKEFRTPFYGTVPTSSLPATNITYDNSDSGIAATNVQDAIDAVAQGGGGGGESNVTVIHTFIEAVGDTTTDVSFTQAVADIKAGKILLLQLNYANQAILEMTPRIGGDFTLENPTPEDIEIQFYDAGLGIMGRYTAENSITWEA